MFAKLPRSAKPGLFALLVAICLQGHAESANNVYAQVSRSVGIVLVSTFEGQLVGSGSAVTVGPQTMVTNHHVLLPGHRYQIYMGGSILDADAGICDNTQDLCLVSVPKLEARAVEFADADKFSVGDAVYAIGAPNEIGNIVGVSQATRQKSYSPPQLSLSNGLITALRPVEDGKIIQTNAAISPGSSGGGLFDSSGRLVGITTFAMRSGQGLNMALPVNWVARLGVTGSPRTTDTTAQTPMPAPMAVERMAPPPTVAEPEPMTRETEVKPTPATPSAPQDKTGAWSGGVPSYVWIAVPIMLLLIWLMRGRRKDDYDDAVDFVPAGPPPALQPFMSAAEKELDQNSPDLNLWNLVIADCKGNMDAARRSYVERRAARLLSEEKDRQWAAAARQSQTP
ncbi:MAG: trypsin-like peptidase domain-containing protein [Rhodocyclaceae bacterium]|nr:trypsin-like peptidase domain-containing protein [Rhodocyclaceae bacterium]